MDSSSCDTGEVHITIDISLSQRFDSALWNIVCKSQASLSLRSHKETTICRRSCKNLSFLVVLLSSGLVCRK